MKTSCISPPPNNPGTLVLEWHLAACGWDYETAALLSLIVNKYDQKNVIDAHHKDENDVSEHLGQKRNLNEDTLIYFKYEDIQREFLFDISIKKISKSKSILKSLGFISDNKRNPDPTRYFDRTTYIEFYPEKVKEWIRSNYDEKGKLKTSARTIKAPLIKIADDSNKSSNEQDSNSLDSSRSSIHPTGYIENSIQENAEVQMAECIIPNGIIDNAKRINAYGQTEECNQPKEQVVDYLHNPKQHDASCHLEECIFPKDIYINQFNQSKSINQLIEIDLLNINEVIKKLKALGLESHKLDYQDVEPTISDLISKGATLGMFEDAYRKALIATKGKGFGINYLNAIVKSCLQEPKEFATQPSKAPTTNYKQEDKAEIKIPPDIRGIVDALIGKGMHINQFFPDVLEKIAQLQQQGASAKDFEDAYSKALTVKGKNVAVNYIATIVQNKLHKSTNIKRRPNDTSGSNEYKSDFSKCMDWLGDLVTTDGESIQ